ncbi:MAG: hypothetical protein AABX73_03360 [Nanoarchaeota archaeon]
MKKTISCIISLTAIKIIFLILLQLSLVSSLEFDINYPKQVEQNKEFTVSISSAPPPEESYDVKIFVNKHTKEFSEIYDGEKWRSPFSYLSSAYPNKIEFKILSHFVGESQLCVRLRKTLSPNEKISEVCSPIEVSPLYSSQEEQEQSTNKEEKEQKTKENYKETEKKEKIKPSISGNVSQKVEDLTINKKIPPESTEKIILKTGKSQVKSEKDVLSTKQEKTRLAIMYSFAVFSVLLIIFLFLKRW